MYPEYIGEPSSGPVPATFRSASAQYIGTPLGGAVTPGMAPRDVAGLTVHGIHSWTHGADFVQLLRVEPMYVFERSLTTAIIKLSKLPYHFSCNTEFG